MTTYAPSAEITNTAKDGGSLGCFARKGADLVLLTAAHVLFASNSAKANPSLDIYSPNYSVCCGGGEKIAVSQGSWSDGWRPAAGFFDTDCAVAKLAGNVQYSNAIPGIGMITGSGPDPGAGMVLADFTTIPSDQQLVRMYSGRKSRGGLRYGTVMHVAGAAASPLSSGPFRDDSDPANDSLPSTNQLVILPRLPPVPGETQDQYTARYRQFAISGGVLTFALKGDSGSVVVDNQPSSVNVIGLLIREYPASAFRDDLRKQGLPIPDALSVVEFVGIVTPISNVLAQMQISIPGGLAGTVPAAGASQRAVPPEFATAFDRPSLEAAIQQLWASLRQRRHGPLIAAMFNEHRAEAMRLVNTLRHVSATWARHQGPAFMRHCIASLRDPAHCIPDAINGVRFADLLMQMQAMLLRYGSRGLRRDLRRLAPFTIGMLAGMHSVHDLPAALPPANPRGPAVP